MEDQLQELQKPKLILEVVDKIVDRLKGAKEWDNLVVELEKALELAKYQRNLSRYAEVGVLIRTKKF